MDTPSVGLSDAILDCSNVDLLSPLHRSDSTPFLSESTSSNDVYIVTPPFKDIPSVVVYADCVVGTCDCVHLIGDAPSQLKPCRAASFLFGDRALDSVLTEDRMYLWKGLVCGFDIVDEDCPASYNCSNYDSILSEEFYGEMTDLLTQELKDNKVSKVASPPRCVHALGAVIKSNGKLRPITDCSRPDASAINNFMQSTFKSFSYNSVEDAVAILDQNDHMAVVDISSAYRSVNINPEHLEFQGLSWDFGNGPEHLVDRRLCFGLRCAPNIFNSISSFVVQIAKAWGASRVINYLDDFLIIAPDAPSCALQRDIVISALQHLGFQISWKKVTDPDEVTTFLGITIDSLKLELSLPIEKVHKLRLVLLSLIDRGHASKKELECVGGLVSHCAYIIKGGRTFSRRIFDLSASYSRHSHRIPLSKEILADFEWWLAFCHVFNGRACMIKGVHPVPIVSDSSFHGFGAWAGQDWIAGFWNEETIPQDFQTGCGHLAPPPVFDKAPKNINVYELWPVVAGLHRWAPAYKNSRLHVITDNMQVLAMLNTGRSINKTCMTWLRELYWICFVNNIDIFATYIKSSDNVLADALSRAAYPGMVTKCSQLLTDSHMCCSSTSSQGLPSIGDSTATPPEGGPGEVYQEVSPLSA